MMANSFMLALTSGEIISIVIAAFVIISGIMGQAAEAKKNQRRREAAKRGTKLAGEQEGSSTLEDIAQRRRAQLEALARRRPGASQPASMQPTNMTTIETVERDEARLAYEERAEALRKGSEVNPMLARGDTAGAGQVQLKAERAAMQQDQAMEVRESARRAKEQRGRRKQQTKQQRRAQQRQQPVLEPTVLEEIPAARQPGLLGAEVSGRSIALSDLGRGASTVDTSVHAGAYESDEVHRHVTDAATVHNEVRQSRLASMMVGRTWRDVLLLKEVLDPPLSMREGGTGPGASGGMSDPWA